MNPFEPGITWELVDRLSDTSSASHHAVVANIRTSHGWDLPNLSPGGGKQVVR